MAKLTRYRFGGFALDGAGHRLTRDGMAIELPPKAFELLLLLVEERARVVSRQELLDRLWPETAVAENTLSQRIKEVREGLGDSPHEPAFIRTIPRVGYQFVATVEEGEAAPATRPAVSPAVPASRPVPSPRWPAWLSAIAGLAIVGWLLMALGPWPARTSEAGATHTLLSVFEGSHRSATVSADGRLMAFVMDDSRGVPQIFARPIDDGRLLQLTSGERAASRPRWSPRGDQIVFALARGGIWTVSPLGGEMRQLIEEGHSPSFSADGSTIVFERGSAAPQSRRWGIWLADADGDHVREVTGLPEKALWGVPTFPALSPDGRTIAFFRNGRGPLGDLWVVGVDGRDARQITHDEVEGGAPVWAPDGRSVIFPSARRGARTLWRVSLADGSMEPVTSGAGSDDEPALSADGRTLVYTHYRDQHAIRLLDPESGAMETVLERGLPIWLPRVSPADDRVAFFMAADAGVQIFTSEIDGARTRQITYGAGRHNIHPTWSRDGQFIYYYRETPEPSFRRIRVDGTDDRELVSGWQWSTHSDAAVDPDGRVVAYTRVHVDTGEFDRDTTYLRDLGTGVERPLEAPHLHQLRWTADGGDLLGQRHDGALVRCPRGQAPCAALTKGGRPAVSPGGPHIFFQRPVAQNAAEVWRIDADGSRETRVGRIGPFDPLSANHEITRTGDILWTEFRPGRRELWLMETGRR